MTGQWTSAVSTPIAEIQRARELTRGIGYQPTRCLMTVPTHRRITARYASALLWAVRTPRRWRSAKRTC